MISLIISLFVLIAGYLIYGKLTERIFGPDGRPTPAVSRDDGVDFAPQALSLPCCSLPFI